MNTKTAGPLPYNEPVRSYAPGTADRSGLKARLEELSRKPIEIPLVIGGKEVCTGNTAESTSPHRHSLQLATWHKAGRPEVESAVRAALEARKEWSEWRWEDRAGVFLRAADLLASTWRYTVAGATMLCQSKTAHQAEIDSTCELIDFLRFNVAFAERIYADQPYSPPGMWNRIDYRGLEGFVYAVTPFNFTAIGGNLPSSAALMGNTVVWKPASSTVYSGYYLMKLFEAAGVPPGVINFIPGDAQAV